MFERFTDRARRVVVQAQEEARGRHHDSIDTTHLLLALIHEGGSATAALESLGASPEAVAQQVRDLLDPGPGAVVDGHIPFTAGAKHALQLAFREAIELGQSYIGTEHILLGLIREQSGTAAAVLAGFGITLTQARRQVIVTLGLPPRQRPKMAGIFRRRSAGS